MFLCKSLQNCIATYLLLHGLYEVVGEDAVRWFTDHCKDKHKYRSLSETFVVFMHDNENI